jgi:hypothetical protein
MNVLNAHLQNAGADLENAARTATKAGTVLDVGKQAMNVFEDVPNPEIQEKMISEFNATAKKLGIANLRKATPEQALALRQALDKGITFNGATDLQTASHVRDALRSAVSSDLKSAVPQFKTLDRAYSDLREARDAAMTQVQSAAAQAPPPSTLARATRFATRKVLPRAIEFGVGGAAGYAGYRLLRDMAGNP